MAVISCVKIARGRRRGRLTDIFQREYSEFYRARTDTAADDAFTVIDSAIAQGYVPDISTPFGSDAGALLKEWVAGEQQASDTKCWILEARYSTDVADPELTDLDPLLEPAVINFDTERIEVAAQVDIDENPFVNSAGDPYDPPQTEEDGILIVQYQDNIDLIPGSQILDYLYHANEVTWNDQDPKTVLCSRFTLRRAFRNGVRYYQRNLEFKVKDGIDWSTRRLLDQGFRVLLNISTVIGAGTGGSMPAKPVLLDGAGGKLSPDKIAAGNVVFNSFHVRDTADFNAIKPALEAISI
jgi:hypothetical protein